MSKRPREQHIVAAIQRAIRRRFGAQALVLKLAGTPLRRGEPDLLVVIGGRVAALEVKVPGRRPTKLQAHRLRAWSMAGALVGVATSVQEAMELVKNLAALANHESMREALPRA